VSRGRARATASVGRSARLILKFVGVRGEGLEGAEFHIVGPGAIKARSCRGGGHVVCVVGVCGSGVGRGGWTPEGRGAWRPGGVVKFIGARVCGSVWGVGCRLCAR